MFCERCGNKVGDNDVFCMKCGNKLQYTNMMAGQKPQAMNAVGAQQIPQTNVANQQYQMQMENNVVVPITSQNKKKSGKGVWIAVIIAIVLLAITGGVVVWLLNKKTPVNLNEYVNVSFTGVDSRGEAIIEFDYDRFEHDTEAVLSRTVYATLDKYNGISNGDVINLTWECDDDDAKALGYKLEYTDIEYTVECLERNLEETDEELEDGMEDNGQTERKEAAITPTPTPEVEIDPYIDIMEGWKIKWDLEYPSLEAFTNYEVLDMPIQYYNNRFVVGKNYGCWSGSPSMEFEYPVRSLYVYLFNNKGILVGAKNLYFLYNSEDASRFANIVGGKTKNNIVYIDGDPRTVIGQTTKQQVVDFHCQDLSPILADGYDGSDLK